jgi:hypothetical protein
MGFWLLARHTSVSFERIQGGVQSAGRWKAFAGQSVILTGFNKL